MRIEPSPLTLHVLPKLGKVPVTDLDQRDIRDTLAPIWHTKADTARKAMNRLALVLKHAAALGLDMVRRCDGDRKGLRRCWGKLRPVDRSPLRKDASRRGAHVGGIAATRAFRYLVQPSDLNSVIFAKTAFDERPTLVGNMALTVAGNLSVAPGRAHATAVDALRASSLRACRSVSVRLVGQDSVIVHAFDEPRSLSCACVLTRRKVKIEKVPQGIDQRHRPWFHRVAPRAPECPAILESLRGER